MFPIVFATVIRRYGWRGSLLVNSALCLNIMMLGALYRPLPLSAKRELEKRAAAGKGRKLPWHAKAKLLLHLFNIVMWSMAVTVYFVMIIEVGLSIGLRVKEAAKMVALFGLSTTLSRLLTATTAGLSFVNRPLAYNVSTIGHGIVTPLFLLAKNKLAFGLLSATFGWFYGIKFCLMTSITADLFGVENLLIIAGLNAFAGGVGCILGPPIAGTFTIMYLLKAVQKVVF